MIDNWQFHVWYNEYAWEAEARDLDGQVVTGYGSTPITALMQAEAKARMVERA